MQSFSSLTRPNEQSRDRSESLTQSYAQAEVKVVFSLRLARPFETIGIEIRVPHGWVR